MDEIPVMKVSKDINDCFLRVIEEIQNNFSKDKLLDLDNAIFDLYQLTREERECVGFIDFGDIQSLGQ